MRLLLFDENLSPRLVDRLMDIYPGSIHVSSVGLGNEFDRVVWDYARQNDYMIVTKDADFSEISTLLGFPPKVVWIRRGNCATRDIENLLRENYAAISNLSENSEAGILALY